MTYAEALAYIASLEPRGWRLGLDRMQALIAAAGLEGAVGGREGGPRFIHVAGTNGKGSTTAYLQSIFEACGFRTGAFFSPYVIDPRERVQFGREMISKKELAGLVEWLKPIAESFSATEFGGITEFEFKTAIGFSYWKRKECDWVALEVGLGGRLDATNVVRPAATIITSISLDHTQILGTTVEEIAREKAGIIKHGIPLIVGQVPDRALAVIEGIAEERRAPLWRFGKELHSRNETVTTPVGIREGLRPGMIGPKQEVNLSLAVAALDAVGLGCPAEKIRLGAQTAWIPGRFQRISLDGVDVVFDGAHNPEAAAVLQQNMVAAFRDRKVILVTNMLSGHDPTEFYSHFADQISLACVVPIGFHRSRKPIETAASLRALIPEVRSFGSVEEGLAYGLSRAVAGDAVLITGSFYLVGEALRAKPFTQQRQASQAAAQ